MKMPLRRMTIEGALRVLLVDDHALFAEGLTLLLKGLATHVTIDVAPSCERAIELLQTPPRPSLVLFDLALPGISHLSAFRLLHEQVPAVPIVAVSAEERPRVIAELLRAGARGYIPKSTSADVTLSALRLVMAGGTYVPQSVVLDPNQGRADIPLTGREVEVLEFLAVGLSNKQIAQRLGMAASTVRVHVTSIVRRLGATSRVDAATSAIARELLERASSASRGRR